MKRTREVQAWYFADHSTRSTCPECGADTYGPIDTVAPSGKKFHDASCSLPNVDRYGHPKHRGFALCRRCTRFEGTMKRALEDHVRHVAEREDSLRGRVHPPETCAGCGHVGTDAEPLGLYGAASWHLLCRVDYEVDHREVV